MSARQKKYSPKKSSFNQFSQTDDEEEVIISENEEQIINPPEDYSIFKKILAVVVMVGITVMVTAISSKYFLNQDKILSKFDSIAEDFKQSLQEESLNFVKNNKDINRSTEKIVNLTISRLNQNFVDKKFVNDQIAQTKQMIKSSISNKSKENTVQINNLSEKIAIINQTIKTRNQKTLLMNDDIVYLKENFQHIKQQIQQQNVILGEHDGILKLVTSLKEKIQKIQQETQSPKYKPSINSTTNDNYVLKEIQEIKKRFEPKALHQAFTSARDGLQVDWAAKSSGGYIINNGNPYNSKWGFVYKSPHNTLILPNNGPGDCVAFKPKTGYTVIMMDGNIIPTGFTYETISIASNPTKTSGPRLIKVRGKTESGMKDLSKTGGPFTLNSKDSSQFFELDKSHGKIRVIRFDFLDNHGNPDYTCVYRIRVHGDKVV